MFIKKCWTSFDNIPRAFSGMNVILNDVRFYFLFLTDRRNLRENWLSETIVIQITIGWGILSTLSYESSTSFETVLYLYMLNKWELKSYKIFNIDDIRRMWTIVLCHVYHCGATLRTLPTKTLSQFIIINISDGSTYLPYI